MSDLINELFWHDGNLIEISISVDKANDSAAKIIFSLYSDLKAKYRNNYKINCEIVSRLNSSLSVREL
jgi:hypothetical protein